MVNTKLNRSKFFSFLISIIVLLNLTSCEGFFTDNNLDQKIRAAIDYANAPSSSFWIAADATAGTINPIGKISYKPTDYQNIKFKLKPEYQFIRWNFRYEEVQSSEKYQREITDQNWWKDYIEIVNEEISEPSSNGEITYSLQIKFIKSEENMLIEPICAKKPAVDEWKPNDDKAGVPAQTEIVITFDSEISENSFIYNQEELSQIAELEIPQTDYLKNDAGKVYGYKYRNDTVYKSIKIYVEGIDYTGSFGLPVIENIDSGSKKYSRLFISPIDVLPCPEDETKTAIVSIELENTIVTAENVSLTPVKYQYRINSKPLEYSFVNISDYNPEEGRPTPDNSRYEFAVGKKINLSFKESSSFQFIHWITNNEKILFSENDISLNPTSFYSLSFVSENEKAKIIPVCVERPKFTQLGFKSGEIQPRDADIELQFNLPEGKTLVIPEDAEFTINCIGRGDVTSSFEAPRVMTGGNKISITAKKDSSRIQVDKNSTVTISIPESIYYEYHDEVTGKDIHVTLGKQSNGKLYTADYTISNTTSNKAQITFTAENGNNVAGSIYVNNVKKNEGDAASQFNIDDNFLIKFSPATSDNYEFLYWTTTNTNIVFEDKEALQTTVKVNQSGTAEIKAVCARKLEIVSLQPSQTQNACDSDILLELNTPPDAFTTNLQYGGNSQACVSVMYNGNNVVGNNYKLPELVTSNGKTYIKLECIKKLNVPAGSNASVTVRIDGTLFYTLEDTNLIESKKIFLKNGSYSQSFNIKDETKNRIYVKFVTSNITLNAAAFAYYKDSSFDQDSNRLYAFNENSSFELKYTVPENIQFNGWNITSVPAQVFTIEEVENLGIKYYTINLLKANSATAGKDASNPIIISDDSAQRLQVVSVTPVKNSAGVVRDSSITITFNKKPPLEELKSKISIICDGSTVTDRFKLNEITNDSFSTSGTNTVLTIPANLNKRIAVNTGATKTVKVEISKDLYYLDSNDTQIFLGKNYEYEYIINDKTNDKAKVSFDVKYGSDSTPAAGSIKLDNIPVNLGITYEKTYNIDSIERELTFIETPDYQFLYWKTNNSTAIKFNEGYSVTEKTIRFTPVAQGQDIEIAAYCAPRLRLALTDNFYPENKADGVEQDSDIKITFNQKPVNYSDIVVYIDDEKDSSHFNSRSVDPNTNKVTINTTKISASGSRFVTTGICKAKVSIPDTLYYVYTDSDGNSHNVYYGGSGVNLSYKINSSTVKKVKIQPPASVTGGSIELSPSYENNNYSIGEKVSITFTPDDDYKFTRWTLSGSSTYVALSNSTYLSSTLTVKNYSSSTFTVTPKAYPRPQIAKVDGTPSVTPYNADASHEFPKDTPITLTFTQPIAPSTINNISVTYTGLSTFDKTTYFDTSISTDNKIITLKPKKMLPVVNSFEIVTVTVPHNSIYYIPDDDTTRINMDDEKDFSWSYRVNYSTTEQTVIRYDTDNANGSQIKVNNAIKNHGDSQSLNVEQTFEVEYPISTGYKFAGWKLTTAASGYTISPSDYVTSGTITIKKGTNKCLTLVVDSANPAKAIITSYGAIANGTVGYGLTLFARDYLQPLATITPDFISMGVDCDSDIQISFNKPVNFDSDTILGNGEIIQIVNDSNKNEHYETYFNSPVISSDRKTLTITPKYSIRDIFSSQADLKDILIKIDYSQIEDDDGYSLDIAENIDWLYRIKYVKDIAPPSIKKLFIARTEADALAGTNLITVDEFEHYATKVNYDNDSTAVIANIRNHHIKDKVWIYYEIEDIQSGMYSLELEEQMVRTVLGQITNGTVYDKTSNPDTHYFASPANSKLISGTIEYSFNEVQDGVVRLSFIAKDKNGNANTTNVDFIKDTIITVSPIVRFGNVEKTSNDFLITENADSYTYKFTFLGQYGKNLGTSTETTFIKDMDGVEHKERFFSENSDDLSYICRMLSFEWWYDGGEKHYIDLQSIQGSVTNYRNTYQIVVGYTYQIPVSIDVNPKKNVNYTCTYCDVVGNTTTSAIQTVLAPKEIKGVNISEEGFSLLFSEKVKDRYCYYIYENEEGVKTELIGLLNKNTNVYTYGLSGFESLVLNCSDRIGYSTDPRNATTVHDVNYPPITTIGNGTYYLYLFEKMSSNSVTLLAGKPFVLYKNDSGFTTNVTSVTLTSSDIPTFTPTFTKAERNSGLLNVHINWQQGFSFNDDYTYYITDGTDYFSGDDFSIKYSSSVKLKVVVYDINTQKIEGSQKTYNISTQYDTVQPTSTNSDPVIFQNCARIHVNLEDPDSGLKKVNNKVIVKALLSDTQGLENLIDWDNYPGIIEAEYHPKVNNAQSGYFTVPIYGICPKYVYYYIEDVAGNYKVSNKGITEPVNLNTVLQISGENNADGGNINLSMEGEPMGGSYTISLYPYYLENNTWKDFTFPNTARLYLEIKTDGNQYTMPVTDKNNTNTIKYDITNNFVKIDPAHYYTAYSETVANRRYAQDSYFYVPYLLAKNTANPIVCNLKDIISGQLGVTVLADQPYFVHTLYCPRNLGSNLDDWLNIGMETGIVMKDTTFTYSYENANDVPSGYYYTIIVHFADGTKVMSDVRQK